MTRVKTTIETIIPKRDMTPPAAAQLAPVSFRLPDSSQFLPVDASDDGRKNEERLKSHLRTSLQMQHLVILCGSGTSIEVEGPSMSDLWKASCELEGVPETVNMVAHLGDDIEEFLSRCDAFLELNPNDSRVTIARDVVMAKLLEQCRVPGSDPRRLPVHRDFLKKIARRRARDSRVKLFTTNYDLCFERAAGELGLVPMDGFSFSNPRTFDPRFFDYDIVKRTASSDSGSFVPGVFQYYKLHGSVDWASRAGTVEIDPDVSADEACLIYPARAKFQRSYEQPHLELMARYLASLREANTCLVVAGFGFNDAHLSGPILSALRSNPHFRLVVVTPEIESKLTAPQVNQFWMEFSDIACRSDAAFVASAFSTFVDIIPDLAALSSAHELESAVLRVARRKS